MSGQIPDKVKAMLMWLDLYGPLRVKGTTVPTAIAIAGTGAAGFDNPRDIAGIAVANLGIARSDASWASTKNYLNIATTAIPVLSTVVDIWVALADWIREIIAGDPWECRSNTEYTRRACVGVSDPPQPSLYRDGKPLAGFLHDGLVADGAGSGLEADGRALGCNPRSDAASRGLPWTWYEERVGSAAEGRRYAAKALMLWVQDRVPCSLLRGVTYVAQNEHDFITGQVLLDSSHPPARVRQLVEAARSCIPSGWVSQFQQIIPFDVFRSQPHGGSTRTEAQLRSDYQSPERLYQHLRYLKGSRWYASLYFLHKDAWDMANAMGFPRACEILRAKGFSSAATKLEAYARGERRDGDAGPGGTKYFPWGPFTYQLGWYDLLDVVKLFAAEMIERHGWRAAYGAPPEVQGAAAQPFMAVARAVRATQTRPSGSSAVGPIIGLAGLGIAAYMLLARRR